MQHIKCDLLYQQTCLPNFVAETYTVCDLIHKKTENLCFVAVHQTIDVCLHSVKEIVHD